MVAQDEWSPKPEVAQDRFYCMSLEFTFVNLAFLHSALTDIVSVFFL